MESSANGICYRIDRHELRLEHQLLELIVK